MKKFIRSLCILLMMALLMMPVFSGRVIAEEGNGEDDTEICEIEENEVPKAGPSERPGKKAPAETYPPYLLFLAGGGVFSLLAVGYLLIKSDASSEE